jgi:hypothetical protein
LREPSAETAEYAANSANAAVVLVFSRQLPVASLIRKPFCGGSGGGIDIGSGANVAVDAVVAVENRRFCHGRNDFLVVKMRDQEFASGIYDPTKIIQQVRLEWVTIWKNIW